MLPDITGKDNADCLFVFVSGGGLNKLLCVPKLKMKPENRCQMLLWTYYLAGSIRCIQFLFHATASNTGHINSACKLKTKLSENCCSSCNVFDIILGIVFKICYNIPANGPKF